MSSVAPLPLPVKDQINNQVGIWNTSFNVVTLIFFNIFFEITQLHFENNAIITLREAIK